MKKSSYQILPDISTDPVYYRDPSIDASTTSKTATRVGIANPIHIRNNGNPQVTRKRHFNSNPKRQSTKIHNFHLSIAH